MSMTFDKYQRTRSFCLNVVNNVGKKSDWRGWAVNTYRTINIPNQSVSRQGQSSLSWFSIDRWQTTLQASSGVFRFEMKRRGTEENDEFVHSAPLLSNQWSIKDDWCGACFSRSKQSRARVKRHTHTQTKTQTHARREFLMNYLDMFTSPFFSKSRRWRFPRGTNLDNAGSLWFAA